MPEADIDQYEVLGGLNSSWSESWNVWLGRFAFQATVCTAGRYCWSVVSHFWLLLMQRRRWVDITDEEVDALWQPQRLLHPRRAQRRPPWQERAAQVREHTDVGGNYLLRLCVWLEWKHLAPPH